MTEKRGDRSLGRPREFNVDTALRAALKVFWRKGYNGASLTDLTKAMGITRPSLYSAFGNKKALFTLALDLYEREKLSFIEDATQASTGREVIERFLRHGQTVYASDQETLGCLMINCLVSFADVEDDGIRSALIDRKSAVERRLRDRLNRAQTEGDFSPDIDATILASYVMAVGDGMALQAAMGASVSK